MKMNLSELERDTLLSWKGASKAILPEEEILAETLKKHQGGSIEISDTQIVVLASWAESAVDHNFGSGAITNISESTLLSKIKERYSALSSGKGFNEQRRPFAESGVQSKPADNGEKNSSKTAVYIALLVGIVAIGAFFLFRPHFKRPVAQESHSQAADEPLFWNVSYVTGDVLLKKHDVWIKLKMGMQVAESDSIRTLTASKATLSNKGKSFTIEENRTLCVIDLAE